MATPNLEIETTEIIISGCGPTGAMLSAQLGLLGVGSVCLERQQGITYDPRGIALDEDGIRALQSIGIYDQIHTDIGQCMGKFNFIGGVHNNLQQRPFMALDYGTSEGGTGHVGFICHKQPALEKHIRRVLDDMPTSQLREGCTLTNITEEKEWVYATYRNQDQAEHTVRGRFLVGSDGKTGFTRKKYLEPKGIKMKQSSAYARISCNC
jgi:2-polyprenyl-6-methoxyphenol hydroxylase-like FAD-dependent oxidoreductase